MHGVIAAGSEHTARAGAEVLRRGGNAADAVAAACFATAAGEPALTSLAGGGIMLYRSAESGEVALCDFFADAPRTRPSEVEGLDFFAVDLDFGPTTQQFHIGAGAAAVPGVIPGLATVVERWGRLSLAEVVAPACEMLRKGVTLEHYQGYAAHLLRPILTLTDGGRRLFQRDGAVIAAGDPFRLPELADTLEALAARGWRQHYEERLWQAMLEQFGPKTGGLLLREDLERYEVRFREPLVQRYRGRTVLTPSPPAAGGAMIAIMLALLSELDLAALPWGSPEHVRRLSHAMCVADAARAEGSAALEPARLRHWRERFHAFAAEPRLEACRVPSPRAPNNTTHVSVIDAEGNAAAVTFSFGEGNAHIIDRTGIMMNNLMGEADLFPAGFGTAPPGERLPTMMSPTLLIADDGAVTVMGTGGANRIRTALVQVISLLCDHGADAVRAVAAPRIHYEDGVLNAEVFDSGDGGDALAALEPAKLVRFSEQSLFFGGVHLVERAADGTLRGAGDPRRGGVCMVV
jgi:gamma-glutamyltranspeptidase/glutathione hydrolase